MPHLFHFIHELWVSLSHGALPDLGGWSYLLLMLLVATEGPLSTLIGAAAAAAGLLDVRLVFLAAAAGNILGDTAWYALGYAGKPARLRRFLPWLDKHDHRIERLIDRMHEHAVKMILVAKASFGLIIPTLVAAGMAHVPWRRWLPTVLLVETVWTLLIVSVGYHATGAIAEFERGLHVVALLALCAVLAGGVLVWRKRSQARAAHAAAPSASPATPALGAPRSSAAHSASLHSRRSRRSRRAGPAAPRAPAVFLKSGPDPHPVIVWWPTR